MHWLLLLLAIGSEIVATSALKETQGFTRLLPSLLCIGGYALAFYLLSVVVKYVPVGIAYALWSGIGVVIVSLVGYTTSSAWTLPIWMYNEAFQSNNFAYSAAISCFLLALVLVLILPLTYWTNRRS